MASDATPTTLELATIEDLRAEIKKRFKGLLFVTIAPHANDDPNLDDEVCVSFHGGTCQAIGLACVARRRLEKIMFGEDHEGADRD